MASRMKRIVLRPIPYLLSDWTGTLITRLRWRKLRQEFLAKVTDKFLELLLKGMDLAFCLMKGYRKNLKNFQGRYVFKTATNIVAASVEFKNGNMVVHKDEIEGWDVRVTFKDAAALRAYIFSRDQDIMDSLLKNDVQAEGNLNHVFKFGFMARDLARRFGVT